MVNKFILSGFRNFVAAVIDFACLCLISVPIKRTTFCRLVTQSPIAEINRASYRYFLWKKLIDAGVDFDFVGSMNTQLDTYSKGETPQPDYKGQSFDKDHEGHFAWEGESYLGGAKS